MLARLIRLVNIMTINVLREKKISYVSDENKNLAIANRSRVSCINTNNNTMTLKSSFEVTQGH